MSKPAFALQRGLSMDRKFYSYCFISWLLQAGRQIILGFYFSVNGSIETTSVAALLGNLLLPFCTNRWSRTSVRKLFSRRIVGHLLQFRTM